MKLGEIMNQIAGFYIIKFSSIEIIMLRKILRTTTSTHVQNSFVNVCKRRQQQG